MSNEYSNQKIKKFPLSTRTILEIIGLLITIGALFVALLSYLNDKDQRKKDENVQQTAISIFVQQRDILATIAVAPEYMWASLNETKSALDNQQATLVPEYSTSVPFNLSSSTPSPTPTAIFTLTPTEINTLTPSNTPTITPTPTSTPAPTETPIILFQDNFDSGLLDLTKWTIDVGNPYVYGKVLRTDGLTVLSVGDVSWTDYVVRFDISGNVGCSGYGWSYVGVRAIDGGNMMAFQFCELGTIWSDVTNNNWVNKEGTRVGTNQKSFKMVISVYGDSFKALNYEPYRTPDHPNGKVYIKFWENAIIDNFIITKLSSPPSP